MFFKGKSALNATDASDLFEALKAPEQCTRHQARRVLKELPARTKISMPEDLLVARIGRNLHDKVAIVQHGPCIVSDCIFTLRVGDANRKSLLAFLTSKSGRQAELSGCKKNN